MVEVRQTRIFADWFERLRDRQARIRIDIRIERLKNGNPGQIRALGAGVQEMKIDYGPGYRVYFRSHGPMVVLLLCGGDKRTQALDIERAKNMATEGDDGS